jgi:hypothetical protein
LDGGAFITALINPGQRLLKELRAGRAGLELAVVQCPWLQARSSKEICRFISMAWEPFKRSTQ